MKKLSQIIQGLDQRLSAILFSMNETAERNLKDPEMREDSSLADEIYRGAFLTNAYELERLTARIGLLCYICRGVSIANENIELVYNIQDSIEMVLTFETCNAQRLQDLEEDIVELVGKMDGLTVIKIKE